MKPRRRHWLHASSVDHGPTWTASRVRPACVGSEEPATPRLCVSASVARCLSARLFAAGPVYLYRTVRPRAGIRPVGVWDAAYTQERWLVPLVGLERVGVVDAHVVLAAQAAATIMIAHERAASGYARVAGLVDAVLALQRWGAPDGVVRWTRGDERFCEAVMADPGIRDSIAERLGRAMKARPDLYGYATAMAAIRWGAVSPTGRPIESGGVPA